MASEQATDSTTAQTSSDDSVVTFNIKASNDQKFVLTLPFTTTVADIKTKLSTPDYADLPVERIRLIYSGRVLKETDTLSASKIKDGHTIHMVKGAASNARQNPANQGGAAAAAQPTGATGTPAPAANVPTNLATGTGNNPLAGLTGARYAGFHGLPNASMFGADGGMGAPPNSDEVLRMMEDPNFLSQMSEMMNNPDVLRMMESSPMMQSNPMMREILRNPEMRRLMFDPNMLRMQMQMQRAMGGGSGGQQGSFPMPGATDTTPQSQQSGTGTDAQAREGGGAGTQSQGQGQAPNPFAAFGGGAGGAGGAAGNPFSALFGSPPGQSATSPGAGTGGQQQQNSMAGLMQAMQMAQVMGGGQGGEGAGANPFASLFGGGGGFGAPPAGPPDNRPPEERYAEQLRQLNDMGFFDFDRNVQALRRTGGSVQGAIEYLLSNPLN